MQYSQDTTNDETYLDSQMVGKKLSIPQMDLSSHRTVSMTNDANSSNRNPHPHAVPLEDISESPTQPEELRHKIHGKSEAQSKTVSAKSICHLNELPFEQSKMILLLLILIRIRYRVVKHHHSL